MNEYGMSLPVKRITRITVALILFYGIYIAFHGHLSPGGGFAGGVILALSLIHVVLAFGRSKTITVLSQGAAAVLESTGALIFLLIAVSGFTAGVFFKNFLPAGEPFTAFSAGTIVLSNMAIFLKVGAGLFSIFLVLAVLYEDDKVQDNNDGEGR